MALPAEVAALAADRRRAQQSVAARVWALIRPMWARIDPAAVLPSWDGAAARPALTVMTGGQLAAAAGAQAYVAAVLQAQGAEPDPVGNVAESALAGIASDGRDLATLLRQPAQDTVGRLAAGMDPVVALRQGLGQLERIVFTQTADASRVAAGVAVVNDRGARGYVRMLTAPSCARCVVLAGRHYAVNTGFQRHPHCDCVHVPAAENVAGHWATSPKTYFGRLSTAEQDQTFGKAGAQAVRDGADLGRVVNARRGMDSAGVTQTRVREDGRVVNVRHRTLASRATTTEGTTRRGRLPGQTRGSRLTPEAIYEAAGNDRDRAVKLLREHGYII